MISVLAPRSPLQLGYGGRNAHVDAGGGRCGLDGVGGVRAVITGRQQQPSVYCREREQGEVKVQLLSGVPHLPPNAPFPWQRERRTAAWTPTRRSGRSDRNTARLRRVLSHHTVCGCGRRGIFLRQLFQPAASTVNTCADGCGRTRLKSSRSYF